MSMKIPKPHFSAPIPGLLDLFETMEANKITANQHSFADFKSFSRSCAQNVGLHPSEFPDKKSTRLSASTIAKTEESVKWAKFVAQVTEEYPEMNEYEACWPLEVYFDNWVHHWKPSRHGPQQKPSESSSHPVQGRKSRKTRAPSNLPMKSVPVQDAPMFHSWSIITHPETVPSASTTDSPASSPIGKERPFVLPLLKPLPSMPWKIARPSPEEDAHLVHAMGDHRRLASLMRKTDEEYWELKMMLKVLVKDHLDVALEKVHWCEVDEIQWRSFVNAACHKDMSLLEYEDIWPVELCIRPYMQQDCSTYSSLLKC